MAGAFERAGGFIISGAATGLRDVADAIMEDSLEECPLETGVLRRSARVFPLEGNGKELTVSFGYGYGDEINPIRKLPAAGYAVPVHEIIEHYHEPPTKAKFLEDPVLKHAFTLGATLDKDIREKLIGFNFYSKREATIDSRVAVGGLGFGANSLGEFPIRQFTKKGQPILQTPKGPKFGFGESS